MKNRKRSIAVVIAVILIFLFVCGKGVWRKWQLGDYLQLNLLFGKIEYFYDDHGGFHGDGETDAVIAFRGWTSGKILQQIEKSQVWEPMPLPEKIAQLTYEYRLADSFQSTFAEFVKVPEITNGYWCFLDRDDFHNGIGRLYNYDALEKMKEQEPDFWPYNFVIAIYDADTHVLYFFQNDI